MADKKIIAVTGATGAQAGGPGTEAGRSPYLKSKRSK